MEEKETLHFKIGLSGSSARKQPEFRISVNGNKQVHDRLKGAANETEYFDFDLEIAEGENFIEIELLNKGFGDTTVDQDGNILDDLLLNIDSIEIDEIDLG